MPKDRSGKRRSLGHESSVKVGSRKFAVQDNSVEHVEIGEMKEASGNEILHAMEAEAEDTAESGPLLKKKEKRQLKHELFMQRLEETRVPYSKSHNRRIKRKERDELAGGALKGLSSALSQLDDTPKPEGSSPDTDIAPQRQRARPGQIGEGKSAPLSQAQRKKALKAEKFRMPLIMKDKNFAANPFATIRTHAKNTLIPHRPSGAA